MPAYVIPQDSSLYRDLALLYRDAGLAGPPPVYPMTLAEFEFYLQKIQGRLISSSGKELVKKINDNLLINKTLYKEEKAAVHVELRLDPEVYLSSKADDRPYDHSYEERPAFFTISTQLALGKRLYLHTDLALYEQIWSVLDEQTFLSENFPFSAVKNFDEEFIQRAFLSVIGDQWSAQVGRDRLNVGNGTTGNLLLSNGAMYHDYVRLASWWDRFELSFMALNVPYYGYGQLSDGTSMEWIEIAGDSFPVFPYQEGQAGFIIDKESRYYLVHRIDVRPFDSFRLAASESVIYRDKGFNFRYLNPMYLFHSHFLRGQADYFTSLDFNWTPFRFWDFYGQVLIDQVTVLVPDDQGHLQSHPPVFGFLAGVHYTRPSGETAYWHHTLELVKLDPYNYIDKSGVNLFTQFNVKSVRYGDGIIYTRPLGYNLGNDLWRVYLKTQYIKPESFELFVLYDFLVQGQKRITDSYPQEGLDSTQASLRSPSGLARFENTLGIGGLFPFELISQWPWSFSWGLYGRHVYQESPSGQSPQHYLAWQAELGLGIVW